MEKEFVPYQQALELKEIGFDEPCFGLYSRQKEYVFKPIDSQSECDQYFGGVLAPTFSQAFRWFRDKYKKVVCSDREGGWWIFIIKDLYDEESAGAYEVEDGDVLEDTYEQAELSCLKKLIKFQREFGFRIKG